MAFSGLQKTRLGLVAFARSLYGSFAGKEENIQELEGPGAGYNGLISNSGIGENGDIQSSGFGGVGSKNTGLGLSGFINNNGIGKTGEI
jgi:hypothetical protein